MSTSGGLGLTQTGLSRSSPSLVTAAAFNLRDFSLSRKKLSLGRPASVTTFRTDQLEEIDLLGGNGGWRQRKARDEFERRRVEEEQRRYEQLKRETEKRRRGQAKEERRRKQQQEEENARLEKEKKKRDAEEERRRLKREQEERERLRKEEEENDRRRRLPTTCQTCDGSGICQACEGKGHVFGLYLVQQVGHVESTQDYGKLMQGCTTCGGYMQGTRGALLQGSGKCPPCDGLGKIWPKIDDLRSPKSRHLHFRSDAPPTHNTHISHAVLQVC
eukprot:TRINITY_DN15326_c1_g1_i1.p1 TRINITY_DN15326_c1_g1~~TRINITY_DN15326_c1_g1_i1.p1  ORF type:complete len:274 (+),score=69.76 TRINITY_DN15326_c1_g1_i1:111-932(+)